MAKIINYLNDIKNAMFGKDVRSSIHDGISAINEEVEGTTARQKDLESTFDELIINAGNSNAEIVDARVGADGTSYAKLGDRLNQVDAQFKESMNNFNLIEEIKADRKRELLNTAVSNNVFFKLKENDKYPILQGCSFSDDGREFYCSLITSGGENEKGVIQKYTVNDISDFSTWSHTLTSNELDIGHANDIAFYNGKIYVVNTNVSPNTIHTINASNLTLSSNITIKEPATAITYNKKLNMFITRRKNLRGTFDFYDTEFNYVKTYENLNITYDTVQGIDSDDCYIYELCSDNDFGNSIVTYDLTGKFIKRLGSNTLTEFECMTNYDSTSIIGHYRGDGNNYLSLSSLYTNRRLTNSRFFINQGRNSVLSDNSVVFNSTSVLKFNWNRYSHLSFKISVDGVETDTKILDITDGQTFHIINTWRMTESGQLWFYRSSIQLVGDNKIKVEPFSRYLINNDGTRDVQIFSQNPSAFTSSNSLGISNIRGQILCGQSIQEF